MTTEGPKELDPFLDDVVQPVYRLTGPIDEPCRQDFADDSDNLPEPSGALVLYAAVDAVRCSRTALDICSGCLEPGSLFVSPAEMVMVGRPLDKPR